MDFINLKFNKRDIIFDGKVRKTTGGTGIISLSDAYLGKRAYVIFFIHRKNNNDEVIIAVDEILNRGIRPDSQGMCRVTFERKYVGRKCLIVIMEG